MIYSIFQNKVARFSDSLAFVLEDGRAITYAQADIMVNHIAAQLMAKGVQQGDRVGAMFECESHHPFVFYALDKLNATYVPFDVNTPKNQLDMDINKLKLKMMIKDEDLQFTPKNVDVPSCMRKDDIPVYIVSSSGATGNKKRMGLEGAGLGYWETTEEEVLKLTHGHKVLCTRSPGYDARISEYLRALIAGGTLYLISRHERKDMDFIIQYCKTHKITSMLLIASQLIGDNLDDTIKQLALAGLKNLIVTGDTCSPQLQALCKKHDINLFNAYGPTEALFGISIVNVNHISLVNEKGHPIVPIGFPVGDDIKVHIIDGRLYIQSPYLIKGYIDDEEKTAQLFSWISIEGKPTRVFDTGDCFEIKEGLLLFKGRHADSHDSKVNGVKVNAHETERLINTYAQQDPNLVQACVISKIISDRTKLVAYVRIKPDFSAIKCIDYLQKWLKAEEIPLFMKIDKFPIKTDSNKIDQTALINLLDKPENYLPISSGNTTNNRSNDTIQKLELMWEDILKIKPNSHDDSFIHQGGDSIFAMKLLKRIQSEIAPAFTHRDLFTLEPMTINTIYERLTHKNIVNEKPMALTCKLTHPDRPGKPNVFVLPPIFGSTQYTLEHLAQSYAQGQDVNMIGLSDPGLYDGTQAAKTMDEAVTRYVNAILNIQPKDPYRLMGFSYGCTLSYFVAKKLKSMGHWVDELHLVDGFSPLFYQNITNEQHATLMKSFAEFIVDTLGNAFYSDPVKMKDLTPLKTRSKAVQINALINAFLKDTQKDLSRNLLEVVRQHLLFLLDTSPPQSLNIDLTRFYVSQAGQSYISLIDNIPGLSRHQPNHTFYYWNQYFQRMKRCGDIAQCNHLELIKNPRASGVFFKYSHDPLKNFLLKTDVFMMKPIAFISRHEGTEYSLVVCNLRPWYPNTLAAELLKEGLCSQAIGIKQDDKIHFSYKPNDAAFEERFATVGIFHEDKLPALKEHLASKSFQVTVLCDHALMQRSNINSEIKKLTVDFIWNHTHLASFHYEVMNCRFFKEIAHEETQSAIRIEINFIKHGSAFEARDEVENRLTELLPMIMPEVIASSLNHSPTPDSRVPQPKLSH